MKNFVKPELLSPVGSPEALMAAVENGADGVYLGGKSFSARQYASNFDDQELIKAIEYCHLQGVKVYITMNTLLKENELKEILDYTIFLYEIGVDALIIQDLGLLKVLQVALPDFPIQSSTQMTIHSIEGVKLLEKEGFYRVVLARELSLEEIKDVVDKSNVEIKLFNHGALCISYSGQCLMSSMIGGRSGNRGRCAQPCRKRYTLVELGSHKNIEQDSGFLLSPKDLSTIEQIEHLIDSGAHSFKIEGRMKRPEYVAIVTSLYRKAIDQYVLENKIESKEQEVKQLKQIFNRGFTTAYLFCDPGKDIISKEKPNHRGIYLGNIHSISRQNNKMDLYLQECLRKGDGIEVWTEGKNNSGMFVPYIEINSKETLEAYNGQMVTIPLLKNAEIGNNVYKTSDISLLKEAQQSYHSIYNRKRKIYGAISIKKDHPLHLDIWDQEDNHISITGEKLVEKAIKRPLDKERVKEQLGKLGGTPFLLETIEIDMEEDAIIALKEVNEARRKAVELLKEKVVSRGRRVQINEAKDNFQKLWQPIMKKKSVKSTPELSAKVNNLKNLKALLQTDISEIIFGGDIELDLNVYSKAVELTKMNQKKIVLSFPRICKQDYISQLENKKNDLIKLSPDGLLLSNLEMIHFFRDVSINKEGDFTLNIFNHLAIEKLNEMGLNSFCISPELTLKEIERLKAYTTLPLSIFIHGDIEMMLSEYCPIACKGHNKQCTFCNNAMKYGLLDEKGMVFPLYMDSFGRSHILNSQKLCLLENLKDITNVGFEKLRLQFLMEEEEEIVEVVGAYKEYIDHIHKGIHSMPETSQRILSQFKKRGLTKGHYYRGVL